MVQRVGTKTIVQFFLKTFPESTNLHYCDQPEKVVTYEEYENICEEFDGSQLLTPCDCTRYNGGVSFEQPCACSENDTCFHKN